MTLKFHRRVNAVSVISFDLDDTLYDNVPVMQRSEANVQQFIVKNYPQTAHWHANDWRQRRLTLMQQHTQLASDMTALRLATLVQGFTEAGVNNPQHAAHRVMQEFHHHRSNFKPPLQTHRVLKQLKQSFNLCAISNGNVNCERIGLASYFDVILQPTAKLRGKPYPDMFTTALAHYAIHPQQMLHIGDHPYSDVFGAHRAGCHSGWFSAGLGSPNELTLVPSLSFDKLEDLLLL